MSKEKDTVTAETPAQPQKRKVNTSLTVGGHVHAVDQGIAQPRPTTKKYALAELSGLVADLEARVEMLENKAK
jgi:ABC-type Fe2+-enterobactin transport system substrate-binding protein